MCYGGGDGSSDGGGGGGGGGSDDGNVTLSCAGNSREEASLRSSTMITYCRIVVFLSKALAVGSLSKASIFREKEKGLKKEERRKKSG